MKLQYISLTQFKTPITNMNGIQSIPVSGDFRFVVVLRRTVLIHDRRNTLIACNNALYGI